MDNLDLPTIAKCFADEAEAYKTLEGIRWPNGPICPHCGVVGEAIYLEPKNGGRKTNKGKVSPRRVWKCKAQGCKKQFSVTVGTIFERSHIPIHKWLMAVYLMSSSKNGVSAHELHRSLDITYKSAWFMCHRVREAMKREPMAAKFEGTVVADETWIGPNPKNFQKGKRFQADHMKREHKTPVLSLINHETGEVRSQVVADVTSKSLRPAIEREVNLPATILHTDESASYVHLGWKAAGHETVTHARSNYVGSTGATTNHAEGYFSQLKRSLDGTFHRISREHLDRYLAEFDYRYSTRKMSDGARTVRTIQQSAGRRLTYREPTER